MAGIMMGAYLVESRNEIHFYRLHRSCRQASLARMLNGVDVAGTVGRPVKVRGCLRQREKRSPLLRRPIHLSFELEFDLNRQVTPPLSDLRGESRKCGRSAWIAGGRTRWRDLTVEAEHVLENS
jgi:hypothetical protein